VSNNQRSMVDDLFQLIKNVNLQTKVSGLISSPTGSGKGAVIAAAVLAAISELQSTNINNNILIIIASTSHKQLQQLLYEFKKNQKLRERPEVNDMTIASSLNEFLDIP
jgi:superfamily II DNA or RNA helicase